MFTPAAPNYPVSKQNVRLLVIAHLIYEYKAAGRTRRLTLGTFGSITVEQARKLALEAAAQRRLGIDPAENRTERRVSPTVNELLELWFAEHVDKRLAVKTRRDYRSWSNKHIRPTIGRRKILDVTGTDVEQLVNRLSGKPVTANRVLSVAKAVFNFAYRRGLLPTNPAVGVSKFREDKTTRYFSNEELARLGETLDAAEHAGENQSSIDCIRLLVLTGCRVSEIQQLRWNLVSFNHGTLELPTSKVGARTVTLGRSTLDYLQRVQTRQTSLGLYEKHGFVCPGAKRDKPVGNLPRWWRTWRDRAGLTDGTLHSLRHSYASSAANSGVPLHTLAGLLGHASTATTERYSHHFKDVAKNTADQVAEVMSGALLGGHPSNR